MIFEKLRSGTVTLEVCALVPEKFLNILWNKNVNITNVVKVDITTIRLDINYDDYKEVESAIKKCKGKVKVVGREGLIFFLMRMRRKATLALGIIIFLLGLYFLSTYVWSVEIKTGNNVAPYTLRRQLMELGIKPGVRKNNLDVYDIEKKLEGMNDQVLWLRARIEGSTLKISIEEKVNPPKIGADVSSGDCVAKMSGEVKRIYITSGTAVVKVGDIVQEGEVLIDDFQGKEGLEYEVPAKGTVIANTFYNKEMEVQISGQKLERTGVKDKDVYISLFGKKIYLKKAINNFQYYDKIEDNNNLLNKVTYFERTNKQVNEDRELAIKNATNQLEESLKKTLKNDAVIKDKQINVKDTEEGKIRVEVSFVVEQDIANS